jgi:hypothetical protein
MTDLAGLYMHKHGLDFADVQLRTRRKVAWLDLVRPPHGYVFLGHSIQEGMAIYQWMVRTGAKYPGVFEVLSCKGTCLNFSRPDAFTRRWRVELRERVCAAILDTYVREPVLAWREEMRIGVEHERTLAIQHYSGGGPDGSDTATARRLDALFGIVGRTLAASHDDEHPKARTVVGVELHVRAKTYALELSYGYLSDLHHGSGWFITISRGGPFLDFVAHCEAELTRLLVTEPTTSAGAHGTVGNSRTYAGWFGDSCLDDRESEP